MGIHDRDYYRDGSGGFLDSWGRQGAVVWLIGITCAVFLAQLLTGHPGPRSSPLVAWGASIATPILSGEVWRLLTAVFLHGGVWHLFVNMLVLYWAGSRMEEVYGPREFLAFYLLAGVFASGVDLTAEVGNLIPPGVGFGASGAVTAVFVLYAFHFPRQQILLFFVIPMPIWAVVVLYVVLDSLGAAGVGRAGVGYFAHLGGALFGLIYYQTGVRFGALFRGGRGAGRRTRPALRVVPVEPEPETAEPVGAAVERAPRPKPKEAVDEHLEAKLDRVLEKVSKYGQDSLTPEEREILFKASELYKKRRK